MNIDEKELRKAEYWRTGDIQHLNDIQVHISSQLIKSGELKKRSIVENGKYNDYLKYSGDQKLLIHIHTLESEIHKQRKELSKERYSKKLHKLVILRNEYAKTAGYGNYLDYKYAEYGVEKELLKQKILKEKNQIHK